jgi:hypothetical protein
MEFGLVDSDGPFVIGQCGVDLIVVQQPTGIVIMEREGLPDLYMNASVDLIPIFLNLISGGEPLSIARSEMQRLDPRALESVETCFWAQLLDDAEALDY